MWCHRPCGFGPRPAEDVEGAKVWEEQPDDKHTWAFIYWCARQGDDVRLFRSEGKITIVLDEHNQADDTEWFGTFDPDK